MKHLITLTFIFTCLLLSAQAQDSTEIKLQHYKDLFIKGLITSQEYEQLKAQTLGLKSAPPQSVVMIKEQPHYKQVDSVTLEKYHNNYKGNIILGSIALSVGVAAILIDASIYPRIPTGAIVATAVFGGVATVIGIVALSKGISQRRAWRRATGEAYLQIRGNGVSLAYNF